MTHLDLYHRTTPEAAAAILKSKTMHSKENGDVFFSTHRNSENSEGYGSAVVHVRVPEHLAEIDDEFPNGEEHYRLRNRDLKPHHFMGVRRVAADEPVKDAHLLRFSEPEETDTGGSKYPNGGYIRAHHPDHGQVGHVQYLRGSRANSGIRIKDLRVPEEHRRKGYGSALMDELQRAFPKAAIDHGDRTDDGKAWWNSYGKGKADRRGRTASRHPFLGTREPGIVDCWVCDGSGYETRDALGCEACDESGYLTPGEQKRWTCPCGMKITKDRDEYTHRDGSISHDKGDGVPKSDDGHYMGVGEVVRTRNAELLAKKRRLFGFLAAFRPTKRLFGPTYGLDKRLFSGEKLKDAIRLDLMAKWHRFCAEQGLKRPDEWSIVYFSGSEASEWTSAEYKGNNDFDVLVGVDSKKFFSLHEPHIMGVETGQSDELAHELTSLMRETLVDPAYVLPGGSRDDPWDQTWFVNPNSYHIADIKPYAAYDVTHDCWAVKPPHLPDWSIEKFPEGKGLVQMGDAYDKLIKAIMSMPEPYRTQQGNALWEHLHSDRSRAFGPNGEGWYDPANVMEKWLDQEGTWADLWELHHRAEEDPSTLLAPAGWSNDPGGK